VGTEHHAIDIARKHTRRVADRLAPPDLHLVRAEYHGIAAELLHPDLERNPGPSRRLLEDHGKHLAGERGRRALAALEGGAELQHAPQLGRIDAVEVEEVPGAAHADRAVQARSTAATAVSTWLRSMIRGGSRRTTLSPAGTVSSPASRQAVTTLPFRSEGGAELQHAPQLGRIDAVEVEEVPGAAHADRAVQARSTAATAVSTWLRSMIRGGSRRTTLSPAGTVSSPASRQAVTTLPD